MKEIKPNLDGQIYLCPRCGKEFEFCEPLICPECKSQDVHFLKFKSFQGRSAERIDYTQFYNRKSE